VNQSLTTLYMKYIVEIQLNTVDSYMKIVLLHENRITMKMYYLFLGVTYLTMFQECTIIFRSECSPEKILPITLPLRIMLLINTKYNFTTILHQYCGSTL